MPEISKAELARLRRAAAYGERARKRDAQVQLLRRLNRSRARTEVNDIGAAVERDFRTLAASRGWDVSKRGWPDFILRRDDKVAFVEVKAYAGKALKAEQNEIALLLAAAGFKVYRWDPESGFTKISAAPGQARPPGGSLNAAEPATWGAKQSRRPTPHRDRELQQRGPATDTPRVSQGTRTSEVVGP